MTKSQETEYISSFSLTGISFYHIHIHSFLYLLDATNMYELRAALIIAVLAALVFSVVGHNKRHDQRPHPGSSEECSDDPSSNSGLPPCSQPLDNKPPTGTNTDDNTGSASTPTTAQRAQWCRFGNGTFLGLGQTYMHTACSMCQCTTSRAIRCTALQCLPTYCIDDSMPSRKQGHCCAQCAYENNNSSCVYKGLSFPHGSSVYYLE